MARKFTRFFEGTKKKTEGATGSSRGYRSYGDGLVLFNGVAHVARGASWEMLRKLHFILEIPESLSILGKS